MRNLHLFLWIVLLSGLSVSLQSQQLMGPAPVLMQWIPVDAGLVVPLRGISLAPNGDIWVSGGSGQYAVSSDSGANWRVGRMPEGGSLDFRDVHAFGDTVYLMSAGNGEISRIYQSIDRGANWTLQLTCPHPEGFFSSMDFWNARNGIVFSDPVEGKFVVYRTTDAGQSWMEVPRTQLPPAREGEYAFAASGSCLIAGAEGQAWIASGGSAARVFFSADSGRSWEVSDTPIMCGTPSAGIFSLAFRDARNGIAVGGDFQQPDSARHNAARSSDGGRTWQPLADPTAMTYRSCVTYLQVDERTALVSVGASGCSYSFDEGESWAPFAEEGYYTLAVGPTGVCWAAGSEGRIARLKISLPNPEEPLPEQDE